jgi:hypothetical protein
MNWNSGADQIAAHERPMEGFAANPGIDTVAD